MFGRKKTKREEPVESTKKIDLKKHQELLENLRVECNQKIKELEKDQELELKEKDFELKHFKDNQLQKLEVEITDLKQQKAILEERTKQLDRIVDLNADIVDVKKLVNQLIDKIPTMDFKNLTINQTKK
jgi:hypothetical protein